MFRFNLLVVAALGAGERPDLPGAVGRDDGGLVPVVDEAAALALLAEGHDRAALVYDLAARHLYRQSALPPSRVSLPSYSKPICPNIPESSGLPASRKPSTTSKWFLPERTRRSSERPLLFHAARKSSDCRLNSAVSPPP